MDFQRHSYLDLLGEEQLLGVAGAADLCASSLSLSGIRTRSMVSCLFAIRNSELRSMLVYEYPVTVRHLLV
jgi:hypothetical protein